MDTLKRFELKSEKAKDFFEVAPTGFTVAGPNPDGSLCVVFTDDVLDPPSLTLVAEELNDGSGGARVVGHEFGTANNIRIFRGRVRLSPTSAKELAKALHDHATRIEQEAEALKPGAAHER